MKNKNHISRHSQFIRSYLIAGLFFTSMCNAMGQEECPPDDFLNPHKTWTEVIYSQNGGSVKFRFDTVPVEENGRVYFELLRSEAKESEDWQPDGLYRIEDGRVYSPAFKEPEIIMYDFNLVEGDTFRVGGENSKAKLVVFQLDTVSLLDGSLRKRWMLNAITESPPIFLDTITWLEGIGNLYGINQHFIPWSADFDLNYVVCVHCDEEIIYHYTHFDSCWVIITSTYSTKDDNIQLFPNPARNEISIKGIDGQVNYIQIFNSIGQLIKTENEFQIKIDDLSEGHYTALIFFKNGTTKTLRFIKV